MCSRSTRFARSTCWSTSEARENYESMARPISASGGGGMRQAIGLHALEMLHVLDRAPCHEPANEREAWKKANTYLFLVLFFMTERSAHITVRAHESKELGFVGDGAAAWNALKERFDRNTNKARRACRKKLFCESMKPGGDPVDFIATMDDLRLRLEDTGEKILDDTYADVLLNSFPKEFEFKKPYAS